MESLVGLLGFALATGILFARFSRPIGELIFSRRAVIAPYQNTTAFMFRVVNRRSNQLIELEATVLFSRIIDGVRRYDKLALARSSVVFFPLSWTIVHPIDEQSPFWNLGPEELTASDAEILILITGTDETFAQSVHARSSYKPNEIEFGTRFISMYRPVGRDGVVKIDVRTLSATERVPAWRPSSPGVDASPPIASSGNSAPGRGRRSRCGVAGPFFKTCSQQAVRMGSSRASIPSSVASMKRSGPRRTRRCSRD